MLQNKDSSRYDPMQLMKTSYICHQGGEELLVVGDWLSLPIGVSAQINGARVPVTEIHAGVFSIVMPEGDAPGNVTIEVCV